MDANQLLVIDIQGAVQIALDDGSFRTLTLGDTVTVGDTVITATSSSLILDVKGLSLSIPANQRIQITPDLLAQAARDNSETTLFDESIDDVIASLNAAETPPQIDEQNPDVTDFLQALEGDGDILDALDATAAGGNASTGSGGGTSFVTLTRIAEDLSDTTLSFDDNYESFNDGIFSLRDTTDGVLPETDSLASLAINELGLINNAQPLISGTSENLAGQIVTLSTTDSTGETQTQTVVIEADGTFSISVDEPFSDGPVVVEVTTTDTDGNPITETITVEVDTIAPSISIAELTDSNQQSPVISGTTQGVDTGTSVSVTIIDNAGVEQVFIVTTQADGTWSVTPQALAEGEYTVTATVTDLAGNSAQDSATANIDLTAPNINLTELSDNSDETPIISGTVTGVDAGASVSIQLIDASGNEQIFTAILLADGSFAIEVPQNIAQGEFTVTASVVDAAGNEGTDTITGNIDLSTLTINIADIGETNDTTPTISGSTLNAQAGDTVTIIITGFDGQTETLVTQVDASGDWQIAVTQSLVEGEFTVSATLADSFGNQAAANATGLIDTTQPTILIEPLFNSNDTTPTITGTSDEIGATVTLTVTDSTGVVQTLSTTVLADGTWSEEVPNALAEGGFTVEASVTDSAGNIANDTETGGVIDTQAPTLDIDPLPATNDTTPTITGSSDEIGATVNLTVTDSTGVEQTLSATVLADGRWSVDVINALAEGEYQVTGIISDEAGNTATDTELGGLVSSELPSLTIDELTPTNDTTPTITGTSDEIGAVVSVLVTDASDVEQNITATVQADGTWAVDVPTDLAEGRFIVEASVTDTAGNTVSDIETGGEIDTQVPIFDIDPLSEIDSSLPTITGTSDEIGGSVTLTVTDAAGALQTLTAIVQADGTWSVEASNDLAEGEFQVSGSISDEAGNITSDSETGVINTGVSTLTVSIDELGQVNDVTPVITGQTNAPAGAAVTITVVDSQGFEQLITTTVAADGSFNADVLADMEQGSFEVTVLVSSQGQSVSAVAVGTIDSIAPELNINSPLNGNDNTPLISGGSDLGANQTVTVVIVDADSVTQTLAAQTDAQGNWQVTSATLADGNYMVTVTALDAADNQGQVTATGTIKTSAPIINLESLGLGNDATPSISGNTDLQAGESVNIIITDSNGDSYQVAAVVDNSGIFSIESPFLPEGNYSIEVSAGDDFGNITTVQGSGVIDTLAPTISINSIGAIDNLTPTISGLTSEPAGKIVQLEITDSENNTQLLSALVNENGEWSVDVTTELAAGIFDVVALIADDAGNASQASEQGNLIADGALININDIGTLNDSTPTISGTSSAAAGVSVSILVTDSLSGTQSFNAAVLADGTWSADVPLAMAEGSFTVRAEVTETGITNFDTAEGLLDLTFPNFSINEIGETNDSTPTISGESDLEAGDVVNIILSYGNEQELSFNATVLTDGSWRVATPQELPEGEFTVVATVEDSAGNSVSASVTGTLDLTPPVITIDPLSPTNDPSPLISGTANEPAGTAVTVEFQDSAGVVHSVQTTVNANGEWQIPAGQDLSEGSYTVTASVVDTAGNQATASTGSFTDYTGPDLEIQPLLTLLGQAVAINGTSDLPAGSEVTVYQQLLNGGLNLVGTAITDSNGNWGLVGLGLSLLNLAGVYAEATDESGNTASDTLNWNDNTPPVLTISVSELTSDNTPTVTGSTDIAPGKQVEVIFTDDNGVNYTQQVTVQADGSFNATAPTLVDGDFNVTVQAIDSSNLVTEVTAAGVIDTQGPLLEINEIGTIGDNTPTISGLSSEPEGSLVNIQVTDSGGQETDYVATVSDGGTWQLELTNPLPNGDFDIFVSATDGAGNTGSAEMSGTVNSVLDTIAINAIPTLNDVTPTIGGSTTLEQGTVINIAITQDSSTQVTSATVDASGNWLVDESTMSELVDGNFTVQASATDPVGNTISTTISAVIDLVAPIINITPIVTDNEALPVISGTSDLTAGSDITVTFTDINGISQSVITQVDTSGNWQVQATTALPEGEFTVLASARDGADNIGTDTATGITDYTGPALAINPLLSVLGIALGVSGTSDLPAGSEVEVTQEVLGGVVNLLGTAVTDDNGNWSLVGLSIGLLNLAGVNATATDEYGNETTARLNWNDNTLPVISVVGDVLTSDDTPTITGTTDVSVGSDIAIVFTDDNGVTYAQTVQVQSGGAFTATAPVLVEGSYSVTATVEEDSGLVNTATFSGTIDITAPSLTVNDLGVIADSTPVISGTSSEPVGSEVSVSVTDDNGANYNYSATVAAGGLWQVEVTDLLANGEFSVAVTAEDTAGNIGFVEVTGVVNASITDTITIDTITDTSEDKPLIKGSTTLAQGTVISIVISQGVDEQTLTSVVDASGQWQVNEADMNPLIEGSFSVSASALDPAGNTITDSLTSVIDLLPTISITTDLSEPIFGDTLIINGTSSEPYTDVTLEILISGQSHSLNIKTDENGNWSDPLMFGDGINPLYGEFNYSASITDSSGNTAVTTVIGNHPNPENFFDFSVLDPGGVLLNLFGDYASGVGEPGSTIFVIKSAVDILNLNLVDESVIEGQVEADGTWEIELNGLTSLLSGPYYFVTIEDGYYVVIDNSDNMTVVKAASESNSVSPDSSNELIGEDVTASLSNFNLQGEGTEPPSTYQYLDESVDLSRVLSNESVGNQMLPAELSIQDVLSDANKENVLALDVDSEQQSLAFSEKQLSDAEPVSDAQSQSEEMIKKLIESGNNQIDM
ncbi:retention module-containing protein [Pseudoalteromonas shioyasakiensis]|uniref:retention module-containing protein n=1 Tax=Pseudoalteromonas shioyasakiensis TaxID=1190813 RepID=UPI002118C777|nr:retention module-containing protein [Pseudoalteromonas shioyasakiensis]MCQ8877401.1 retention module-containing protein [Pseudoalteromonas shioyasakiensis]